MRKLQVAWAQAQCRLFRRHVLDDVCLIPVDGSLLGCQRNQKQATRKEKGKRCPAQKRYWNAAGSTYPSGRPPPPKKMAPKRIICHKTEGTPRANAGSSQQHDPRTTLPGPSPHHAATLLLPPFSPRPSLPFPDAHPMHTFISGPIPAVGRPFFCERGRFVRGAGWQGCFDAHRTGRVFSPHIPRDMKQGVS